MFKGLLCLFLIQAAPGQSSRPAPVPRPRISIYAVRIGVVVPSLPPNAERAWRQRVNTMIAAANRLLRTGGCNGKPCAFEFRVQALALRRGDTPETYAELVEVRRRLGQAQVLLLDGFEDYYLGKSAGIGKPYCYNSIQGAFLKTHLSLSTLPVIRGIGTAPRSRMSGRI